LPVKGKKPGRKKVKKPTTNGEKGGGSIGKWENQVLVQKGTGEKKKIKEKWPKVSVKKEKTVL